MGHDWCVEERRRTVHQLHVFKATGYVKDLHSERLQVVVGRASVHINLELLTVVDGVRRHCDVDLDRIADGVRPNLRRPGRPVQHGEGLRCGGTPLSLWE